MLGDRKHDIVGARENRIAGVGALWGYGGEAELTEAGARTLARDPGVAADQILARLAIPAGSD